jgi:hypothetical protein
MYARHSSKRRASAPSVPWQVPEKIEVHEPARMRETLGHDVHVAGRQADEERGGNAEQIGHDSSFADCDCTAHLN